MPKCSNAASCFINFLSLLVAIPLLCFGLWLKAEAKIECQRYVYVTVIAMGGVLLILSLLGIFGSCCRLNFFLGLYLFFMFLLMLAIAASISFTFYITSSVTIRQTEGSGVEYMLGNPSWLQDKLVGEWATTEKCMKEVRLCDYQVMQVLNKNASVPRIFKAQMTPIEMGCCKPASGCGFTYVNATYWEAPSSGEITSTNPDCKKWSNAQDGMCYGCDSCKAGMVESTKRELKRYVWLEIAMLLYISIVYSIASCAFSNNRRAKYYR